MASEFNYKQNWCIIFPASCKPLTFITVTDVFKVFPWYVSLHHEFIWVDLHLLEAPHAVQYVELLPAFGEIDLPVDEVGVPQVDKGQVLEDETPGGGRTGDIESTRGPMCGFKHECNHWLTGTGYTEARLQPERLCMLWRRRSCQSTCNIPPIPEREEGVRATWEKGHNDGDDAHQWEGDFEEHGLSPLTSASATPVSWWGQSPGPIVLPGKSWNCSTFLSAVIRQVNKCYWTEQNGNDKNI